MASRDAWLLLLLWAPIGCWCVAAAGGSGDGDGSWELLLNSSGVVAMHMALTHQNSVVMLDQTSAGPSGYRLRHCHHRQQGGAPDCWAHSVEYDIAANSIRPLFVDTDTWCSSGALLADGTLVQTGGNGTGARKLRRFRPCVDRQCQWRELDTTLVEPRWYATNQLLPNGERMVIVGGRNAFSYEFAPPYEDKGAYELPFLRRTRNRHEGGDNLYPFVHLSPTGHLFVFANRDSILLDINSHQVLRHYPRIPFLGARNYPSTGSSVLLPLDHSDGFRRAEIMVCGGASPGAYAAARRGVFLPGLRSCGRLVISGGDNSSKDWAMEYMPRPRLMADMLLLPTGDVLLINGARRGCAGWQHADRPSYHPFLYKPDGAMGSRFSVCNPTSIARLYHSSAVALPDGRILVAGSNPHEHYTYHARYPTELRVETFSPEYLNPALDHMRPMNVSVDGGRKGVVGYGEHFSVGFMVFELQQAAVDFRVYAPPFATHSQSMGQRLLRLRCTTLNGGGGQWQAILEAPPSWTVAPPGYYLLSVINRGIPSKAEWVRFGLNMDDK